MKAQKESCETCEEVKRLLSEWTNQQGHDRCWYYPEIFQKLIRLLGLSMKVKPSLPPRDEFEKGCRRYQDEEFGTR